MPRILSALLVLAPAAALAQEPKPAAAAPAVPAAQAAPAADAPAAPAGPDLAKLDALWLKRGESAAAKELEGLLDAAAKQWPDNPAVLWRLARWKYWDADTAGAAKKKTVGKEVWALGDKVAKLDPKSAEGAYYGALGIAQYSYGVGILNALTEGLEGKYNERLDKAIQLNASLDGGGPMLAKGRYFFELPWPMRNLGKSAEWLNKCLSKHPNNLRAHMYLAETLLKDGKAQKAKEHIERALNGSGDDDPAEAARVKVDAKKVQTEIEKELK
jgi:tetratricopeptide (TPR) repeat protein